MIAGYWILAEFFFFRIFMNRDEVEVYENGKKKKTNTRLISNNHDRTSLVNNGFLQGNRYWLSLFRHGG